MSADQLISDELLPAHSEPHINNTLATAGGSYEIRIDGSHRILNSPAASDGKTTYVMLIVGVLLVTIVPWVIINMSGLPTLGTSPGNGVSSIPNQSFNAASDRMPDAQKGESLQIRDAIAGKVDRDALAATLQDFNLSSASAASAGTAPSKHSTGVQRTGVRAKELRSPTKLPPTPETRPTTIPGWTLREKRTSAKRIGMSAKRQ